MKRTIAAILASDVAGYSRLIAQDEEDALRRLAAAKTVFRAEVARFGGRVFNTAGDAILAEFPSAVEALRAGLAIQGGLNGLDRGDPAERRLRFRMGLHIGDVVAVDGDLLGDGVNVAARLEGLAEAGGICLSRSVHEAVAGKAAVTFRDIGAQRLKNIPRPVHAFRVVMPDDPARAAAFVTDLTRRARGVRLSAAALLIALGLGLGAVWIARPDLVRPEPAAPVLASAEPEPGADRDDLIPVSVARPRRTCFQDRVRLAGTLVARRAVDVAPEAEGLRTLRVLAEPLETVRAGQTLAQLVRIGDPDQRPVAVRSPVAGLIVRSRASVGASAPAAGPALFEVAAGGEVELEAEMPLSDLRRIVPGQEARILPLGGTERRGSVRRVTPDVDPATQLGKVRVLLDPGGEGDASGLRLGQFAGGTIRIGERCGVAVPYAAVAREAEGAVIYVASGRRAEARPVQVGLTSETEVEIRDGIDPQDAVVQRAGPFLREGDLIRPVPVSAPR